MKLVFLHGVGDGDATMSWLDHLNQALEAGGHARVEEKDVVAPRYAGILNTHGIHAKMAPNTTNPGEPADRRAYERRQGAVARLLGMDPSVSAFGFHLIPGGAMSAGQRISVDQARGSLRQVTRYVRSEGTRGAVMAHILDNIPHRGEVVIVGHSLGSVIAMDLVAHLPGDLRVKHLITIGSPASAEALDRDTDRLLKRFPYGRVNTWSNFYSREDIVTGGRGLAAKFPGAQDFVMAGGHGTSNYLGNSAVATLIADGLRPPSKEIRRRTSFVTTRLSDENASMLLMLHFAGAVRDSIRDKDAKVRYGAALQIVLDDLTERLFEIDSSGQPMARELHELAAGDMPSLPKRWEINDAVDELVVLAMSNHVAPYEIEVDAAPKAALQEICVELGFTRTAGEKIGRALDEVKKQVGAPGSFPWGRVLTAAAGLSLIALGPIGLAVAAPAGVAGAAALTGGLAALGPGGMIGGIAAIGGLTGAGAAVTTAAVATGSAAGQQMDSTRLILRVAADYSRKLLDLPYDSNAWYLLGEAETHLGAAINRWAAFSDPKAPGLSARREELAIVKRLLQFMRDHEMAPTNLLESASVDGGPSLTKAESKELEA